MTKTHASCHDPANSAVPASAELSRSAEESSALAAHLSPLIGRQSVSAFGRKCGIAESVLRSYLHDRRMPPLDKALAIARAAGVTVDWLATGVDSGIVLNGARHGETAHRIRPVGLPRGPEIDAGLLADVLEAVLRDHRGCSPEELATLAVERYRRAKATDSQR